jgi:hypothetical protein
MIIYWASVIENIGIVSIVLSIVFMVTVLFLGVALWIDPPYDDEEFRTKRNVLKRFVLITAISLMISIFTPSAKTLLAVYFVDNLAEYSEKNDKIRELPDKVIECCDKLLNEYLDAPTHRE